MKYLVHLTDSKIMKADTYFFENKFMYKEFDNYHLANCYSLQLLLDAHDFKYKELNQDISDEICRINQNVNEFISFKKIPNMIKEIKEKYPEAFI